MGSTDRIDEWEDFFESEEGGSNESSHGEEEAALACFFRLSPDIQETPEEMAEAAVAMQHGRIFDI